MVRDLAHVVTREKAKIGVFITLVEPTKPMVTEAVKMGFYETPYGKFPKLQILTVQQLLDGKKVQMPWVDPDTFKKAAREITEKQNALFSSSWHRSMDQTKWLKVVCLSLRLSFLRKWRPAPTTDSPMSAKLEGSGAAEALVFGGSVTLRSKPAIL